MSLAGSARPQLVGGSTPSYRREWREADENRKERLSISGRYPRSLSETSTEKPGMKHEAALKAADTELTRSCQLSFTSSVENRTNVRTSQSEQAAATQH